MTCDERHETLVDRVERLVRDRAGDGLSDPRVGRELVAAPVDFHALASETGLEVTEYRRIVKAVQKGEREARQAKKEMRTDQLRTVFLGCFG